MHGGMERGERERVQREFNRGGSILLATDAASEGLNLHHSCRVVVHYELPWRPARIEQRVGRIDRLGQSRRVHEIALVAAGTVERLVLAPLISRVARARASGTAATGLLESLSEATVLELIMGGELPVRSAAAAPTTTRRLDLRDEAAAEVSRLELTRTYLARSPPLGRRIAHPATVVCEHRRRTSRLTPGVVAVFRLSLADVDGRPVHAEAVGLRLDSIPLPHRDAGGLRALAAAVRGWSLNPSHQVYQELAHLGAGAEARTAVLQKAADRSTAQREEALRRTPPSAATQMVQAGLFDRRALSARARATAARTVLLDVADARQDARERSGRPQLETELIAVVVLSRRRR